MSQTNLAEPWRSFLKRLDEACLAPTERHCLGGFVMTQCYGLPRATADVDVMLIHPQGISQPSLALAGRGSALHKKLGSSR